VEFVLGTAVFSLDDEEMRRLHDTVERRRGAASARAWSARTVVHLPAASHGLCLERDELRDLDLLLRVARSSM